MTTEACASRYPHDNASRDFLRIVACGSVDDGKSTLIGRLLHEAGRVPDDERAALAARTARRHGTRGGEIDYALLLDGLDAEREQGITIDVAWRHLQTATRRYLIADCPGHEQYTRNMATGASVADLAIVLVDATKGLLPQTFRHTAIASLFGVRHVLLAVNKMDRIGYDQAVFDAIADAYRAHAAQLGIAHVVVHSAALRRPARTWSHASPNFGWYDGPSVLGHLERVRIARSRQRCRLPRCRCSRSCATREGRRWLAGTLASGRVRTGDAIVDRACRRRGARRRTRRWAVDVCRSQAQAGDALSLRLREDVDISRGDVLAAAGAPLAGRPTSSPPHVLWIDEAPLLPGRRYWLKLGTRSVGATRQRAQAQARSGKPAAARREAPGVERQSANCNAVARRSRWRSRPTRENKTLGGFILIDPLTRAPSAAA